MVPILSQENRQARLDYCLEFVQDNLHFHHYYDYVWIDEKRFQCHPDVISAWLAPGEPVPYLPMRKKNHLVTVTFLAAVARPRRNVEGEYFFDGLVGIWPFVASVPAQRASRNRPRGTLETKDIKIDIATFEEFYVQKLLPAIQEKCPHAMKQEPIYIQMDNAPVHKVSVETMGVHEFYIHETDPIFAVPVRQPPNSPDLNVLDLGVFRTVQVRVSIVHCRTMDEVVERVNTSFFEVPAVKIDKTCLSLMAVQNAIIGDQGGNNFSVPHLNKDRMIREEGQLPITIRADSLDVINEDYLDVPDEVNVPNILMNEQGFEDEDYDDLDG
jgi:hypothetical protein